jgi:hypothetical protein
VARRVLPWRPGLRRERAGLAILDPVTLLLQALSLLLLLLEFILAPLILIPWVMLRRPWRVEALTAGPPRQRLTWRVHGFGPAGEQAQVIAAAIAAHGEAPFPPHERRVG